MKESILIVGGGVAGLTTKKCLENQGYSPILAEKSDNLRTDGAGLLLGANVLKIFRELGLEKALLARSQILDEMVSLDDKGGTIGHIDLAKIRNESSYPTVAVHRHELHNILSSCSNPETYWLGHKVLSVQPSDQGYNVTFANEKKATFDRVIAADGLYSQVRATTYGLVGLRHTAQACWRFIVDLPKAINERSAIEMWGNRKRIGIFPIGNNKCYIFLVASMNGNEEAMTFDEVLEHFNEFKGPWIHFKNSLDIRKIELLFGELADAEKITLETNGIPFIGDAGHSTTPNMGQGAAMGIESAFLLGELLKTDNFDAALGQYKRKRYNKVNEIREKSMKAGQLAHIPFKTLQSVRNFLMRLIPQSLIQKAFEKALFE